MPKQLQDKQKVIITITDDDDDETADFKMEFYPPIKDLEPMKIESPALHLAASILSFVKR